jgi:predicted TIM-barrel fold metal-dependent hydrolase
MTTTPVVDADSHFWEPFGWLRDTDPDLQAELDETLPPASFAEVIFGEVIAELPERQQQEFMELFKQFGERAGGRKQSTDEMEKRVNDSPLAAIFNQPGARDAADRLAWCDERGIDVQIISPTTALGFLQRIRRARPDLLDRFCRAYNDWATGLLAGFTDRLIPTAVVDFADPAVTVAELERVRERGSRAFLVPMYPVAGRALAPWTTR